MAPGPNCTNKTIPHQEHGAEALPGLVLYRLCDIPNNF
jgi:hypothetical protein